jgi:hypothetical protein
LGEKECQRANVAFSLYGIKHSDRSVRQTLGKCSRFTFINSFFTATGFDIYTQSIESIKGATVFSTTDAETLEYLSSNDNNNGNDNGYPGGLSSMCYSTNNNGNDGGSAASFAIGCYRKNFVAKSFEGTYCDGAANVTNSLNTFNKEMKNVGCVEIYKDSSEDNENEDENANKDNNGQSSSSAGLALLSASESCSIREYPNGGCPDPYGILASYTSRMEQATGSEVVSQKTNRIHRVRVILSWIFFALGILFLLFSLVACYVDARRKRQQRRLSSTSKAATQKAKDQSKAASGNRSSSFRSESGSRRGFARSNSVTSFGSKTSTKSAKSVKSAKSGGSNGRTGPLAKMKSMFRRA